MSDSPDEYSPDAIQVLRGLDAVRQRPDMYVGDLDDGTGLHNMVNNVVGYAVDDPYVRTIVVRLNADKSCTVRDDGPGMPTDMPVPGLSAAEVIVTGLYDWPQAIWDAFGRYCSSNVLDICIANFLSSSLKLTIWRGGKEHFLEFRDGAAVAPLAVVGDAGENHGTEVTFLPNPTIFSVTKFDFATLERRMRSRASGLFPGTMIVLSDLRDAAERRVEIRAERTVEPRIAG